MVDRTTAILAANGWRQMVQSGYLSNAIALSDESIALLEQDFSRYREPIPHAVVRYLVDGGDDAVLQQLQESSTLMPDERSMGSWNPYPNDAIRRHLLQTLTTQDLAFYDRLTRTYEIESLNLRYRQFQPSPGWLVILFSFLVNLHELDLSLDHPVLQLPPVITADLIEALLRHKGESVDALARLVFLPEVSPEDCWEAIRFARIGASLSGFVAYSLRHEAILRLALGHAAVEHRIHALEMLALCQMSPLPLADLLIQRATATSKSERAAALRVVQREAIAMIPYLQTQAQTGKAKERAHAAKVLSELAGVDARPFLENRLELESTATVRDAIQQVLTDLVIISAPPLDIRLAPLPAVMLEVPLPPGGHERMTTLLNTLYARAQAKYDEDQCQNYPDIPLPQPPTADFVDQVVHGLQSGTAADCLAIAPIFHYLAHPWAAGEFCQLLQCAELELIHVVRLLILLQLMPTQHEQQAYPNVTIPWAGHWKESEISGDLNRWCQRYGPSTSLRYLVSGLEALGISGDVIAWKLLNVESSAFWSWGNTAVAEYFTEHLSIIEILFGLDPFPHLHYPHEQIARRQLFRILELFPHLPTTFVPRLWDIALNGLQAEMPLAQRCLDHRPGTLERLHPLIDHSDATIQVTVIHWLTRLKDHTAIPRFQDLLRRKASGAVRDALLRSLETLGATIDEFLDRSHLLQEAQTGLRKAIPKALSWFKFEALPAVHWHDTGEQVAPEILTWLLVQSFQLKNPEPSPVLRQYAKLWEEGDRQALGQFVLESWVNQDTQVTSAVKEKGMLAVSGACGGAAMVPIIHRYLKTYFGSRLAQCLALLQMLTWSDDFAAIQLLLSVANRFRTQKIQDAARQGVYQLAQRQGWTLDELGDRTIPWCGLAEDGTLGLDYGPRQVTARLNTDGKLVLITDSGKEIKSPPAARKDDDADQVKAAKQLWTQTKKQVDLVRSQQQARLYEALCTQRGWTFADWHLFLQQHPLVGRLCQRLIWAVFTDDSTLPSQTFQPQDDGRLVDTEGRGVTVAPAAIVRLAHASLLPEAVTQAWQQHFTQHSIKPLFEPWSMAYHLPTADQRQTEITAFVGHPLSRYALRQRAMHLGYLPQADESDERWTVAYQKTFESLPLNVVIGFSGDSPISQEDLAVQLGEVCFWQGHKLSLAQVPPVLLSMVWSEIQTIVS